MILIKSKIYEMRMIKDEDCTNKELRKNHQRYDDNHAGSCFLNELSHQRNRKLMIFYACKEGLKHMNKSQMLEYAIESKDNVMIEFSLKAGAKDWDRAIHTSAKVGLTDLVDFFKDKNECITNSIVSGIQGSAERGCVNILQYFLSLDNDDPDIGMQGAALGGQYRLIKYFISKGADDWNRAAVYACAGRQLNILKYFISKGAWDFDEGIQYAEENDYDDILDFLREKELNEE